MPNARRFTKLGSKEQRGSKPRCHWMTEGSREVVSSRLTAMVAPWAQVSAHDRWMPVGFDRIEEAQLDKAANLLEPTVRFGLARWWLPVGKEYARTPNFDIASTCTINGRRGLLLVEAKAHAEELHKESAGRLVDQDSSEERKASHGSIGKAIAEANLNLKATTNLPWGISRDTHYQLSNRFAWSWKLALEGVPVVLVYLGFIRADEMADKGAVLADGNMWEHLVRTHSHGVVPVEAWEHPWVISGTTLTPLVRSVECPLDGWE